MAYYIKKASILGSAVPTDGVEYYTGENNWSNEFSKRKSYSTETEALEKTQTTETRTIGGASYTYQPDWWKNAVVVSE